MRGYVTFDGTMRIREERRDEFVRAMDKVLFYGGMMHLEKVKLYGRELRLLSPVRVRSDDIVPLGYNYFEDNSWEHAYFDANNAELQLQKVGEHEFSLVVAAALELYDLYGEEPGIVGQHKKLAEHEEVVDAAATIGWVNHLMGTDFTLEHRLTHLWEIAEEHLWVSKLEPFALVPAAYASAAASLDYADLCYVAYGTNVLTEDKVEVGSYSELVLKVKRALERYLEAVGRTELSMAHLFDLVSHERAQRDGIRGGNLAELAALSLEVPARVIVYLVCELQGLEFWQEWGKLKDVVYHDEVMRPLVPAWLEEKRGEALRRPVEPVRTSQYLYDEGDLVGSLLVPRALKHARNYYVSDDDRLFWWDGTDEVIISPKCDAWLHKLARRYQEIMAEMEKADENVVADDADWPVRNLIVLFAELNEHYGRLYPFEGMYYEFLLNATKMPWRAAIVLIREIGEEMHEKGSVIRHLCGSWDETGKKVTFNEGRVTMKRLYGAMANRRLRERYFGF